MNLLNLAQLKSLWMPNHPIISAVSHLRHPFLLLSRLYVAHIFFKSGLTKINDWSTTVALFTDEYKVPFLSPSAAAVLGTAGELVLPVLLAIGLFGRCAALGLFVVNAVAVVALSDIAPPALQQHVFWGWLLAVLALIGLGQWTVDYWIGRKLARQSR
jgi:putative oxidoreductase